MSPLVLGEVLAVFVNRLTVDGKYPVHGCENLQLPIQMRLSENKKLFSQVFVPFLESTSNFKHFEKKKDDLKNEKLYLNFRFHFWNLHQILNILKENIFVIAYVFSKLQTVKNLSTALSNKRRFRPRFDSYHVKVSQILAKYPWKCFYHIFPLFSGKLIWKMSPLVFGEILGLSRRPKYLRNLL